MTREIKFRAWDKETNQMLIPQCINWEQNKVWFSNNVGDWIALDVVELMQFTGLHDKNGKEIYEGDIILLWENDKQGVAVLWDEEIAGFGFKGQDMATHLNFRKLSTRNYVIIGNIYENSELLK